MSNSKINLAETFIPKNDKSISVEIQKDVHFKDRRHPVETSSKRVKKKTLLSKDLKITCSIAMYLFKKFWMSCSAAVFIIFVIFWCYGSGIAFILFLFALSGLIFQLGDLLLYHPDQPPQSQLYVPLPILYGLPAESIFLKTSDGVKLHAFFIKQDASIIGHVPTVLYFHGNAGNIGHRLPNAQGFFQICGCNIFLLEYRGFGHSKGTPNEEGLYLDAQAALQYLLQVPYIDKSKIVVFGRSLGGAVAIDLASRTKFGKCILLLIVENSFTSIPDIAKSMFKLKIIEWLPYWMFKNQFFSLKKMKTIKTPVLFIHGNADRIIPSSMMKAMYQVCESPLKRFLSFEYGTHNETWQCKGYYQAINMFVDDVMLLAQQAATQWPSNCFERQGEIY